MMVSYLLSYDSFKQILNKSIFFKVKLTLLEEVAKNPDRYIGLFRPTKPKAKLIQNITQSNEIRFGDAFEIIIEEYLKILKFEIKERKFVFQNDSLIFDQLFAKNDNLYFIEQKLRDDHDSTKKRGQIENFEKKSKLLLNEYPDQELTGIMYFIDPGLSKNEKYYISELRRISKEYELNTHLFYGKELFTWLEEPQIWDEIITYLTQWKNEIPDLPIINFDQDPEDSFEQIKHISPKLMMSLCENEIIYHEIILTLFPEKKTLHLLLEFYKKNVEKNRILKKLVTILEEKLGIMKTSSKNMKLTDYADND